MAYPGNDGKSPYLCEIIETGCFVQDTPASPKFREIWYQHVMQYQNVSKSWFVCHKSQKVQKTKHPPPPVVHRIPGCLGMENFGKLFLIPYKSWFWVPQTPTVVCVSQIGAESLTFGVPSGGNRVNPWEEPRGDQPDVCNAWGLEMEADREANAANHRFKLIQSCSSTRWICCLLFLFWPMSVIL